MTRGTLLTLGFAVSEVPDGLRRGNPLQQGRPDRAGG